MKKYGYAALLLIITPLARASGDFTDCVVIPRPFPRIRTSISISADDVMRAAWDTDIMSLSKLQEFLCKTKSLNGSKLHGENLLQVRIYWNKVAPFLLQKFAITDYELHAAIENISVSINIKFKNTNSEHKNPNSEITVTTCTYDTHQKPIKLDTSANGLQTTITLIIKNLIQRYNDAQVATSSPYLARIFPADANTLPDKPKEYIVSTDFSLQTLHAALPITPKESLDNSNDIAPISTISSSSQSSTSSTSYSYPGSLDESNILVIQTPPQPRTRPLPTSRFKSSAHGPHADNATNFKCATLHHNKEV